MTGRLRGSGLSDPPEKQYSDPEVRYVVGVPTALGRGIARKDTGMSRCRLRELGIVTGTLP
ncbi:MAG TPA: hypothetical protein VFW75_12395, partial [Acetobacteraceae bacterium]|nr:hypothetical protein [Acetobacteraceae bacterium]